MGAKRVQVSSDNGTVWRTLPGATGEFTEEMATVNDTVFGQDWESNEVSIGQWNVSANGFFKGVAGYAATLKQQGTPVVMTAEAMSLVSGKTYQVTAAAKRVIDYFSTVTVLDNAVDHTADVVSIDYLFGKVTFAAAYTPTGPITITGKYVPMSTIAKGRSFNLNMTAAELDKTVYESAQANGGWRTFDYGLRTVSMDMSGIFDVTNGAATALRARTPLVIECSPDGTANTLFRGYFKRHNRGQSGDVGALEEETQTFGLWVPDGSLVVTPFSWLFTAQSALNLSLQACITAWQNKTPIDVRYQNDPDVATSGQTGDAVVTECTLQNSFEGLNEFRLGFRGTGAPTAI